MKNFIIKILYKIQDKELNNLPEKMNTDLILKCSKLILKLRGINPVLNESEIKEKVEKLFPTNK